MLNDEVPTPFATDRKIEIIINLKEIQAKYYRKITTRKIQHLFFEKKTEHCQTSYS